MIFAIAGVVILVISIVLSLLLVNRNATARQQQTKILLFAMYFWLLTFIQLIVAAIGYSIFSR